MPMKANVGVTRKIADNNFGSRGAAVNLEVELDSGLIQEPERLQERIRQVFRLAQQAVDEELSRQNTETSDVEPKSAAPAATATTDGNGNGRNGQRAKPAGNGNGHVASEKQTSYARQLAGQISGLGVRRLETLANKMFGRPLAALTSLDASGLIDTLKAMKAGEIDVTAALGEAAV